MLNALHSDLLTHQHIILNIVIISIRTHFFFFFFFNDTATTEIYTLSYTTLFRSSTSRTRGLLQASTGRRCPSRNRNGTKSKIGRAQSELQSPYDLVCRLLLEKKKRNST